MWEIRTRFVTLWSALKFCFVLLCLHSFDGIAQTHVLPENGGNGISWRYNKSFVITWEAVENAVAYEYVISDNPLCFRGCSGDTRYAMVKDTVAISFEMQDNKWYYWTTRVITETDTSYWSEISSFLTSVPENGPQLFTVFPNPLQTGEPLQISVDWFSNPRAREIEVTLYDTRGNLLSKEKYNKSKGPVRFESFEIRSKVPPGNYIAIFIIDDNPHVPENRIIKKIVVQ